MASRTIGALAASTILATQPAWAQGDVNLGTLLLTASLSPVDANETGATVEVIETEDEETGSDNLSALDQLTRLPGVNFTSNGPLGTLGNIQVRGLPGRYVGIRINGIDVSDPSGPQIQFDYGSLTSSGIERVELLKGSQSALYGSEAIGGVINFTTWKPTKLGFSGQVRAEAGAFDTYSGTFSGGYKSERGYVALSIGQVTTEGFSAQTFNTEDDGFDQTTVNFSTEFAVTDFVSVGGAVFYRNSDTEFDRSSFTLDATGEIDQEDLGIRVFAKAQTGVVSHELSYFYYDVTREIDGAFPSRFTGERQGFAYLGSAQLGDMFVLNGGVDYVEEDINANGVIADEDNTSVMTEVIFSPSDQFDVSAALRYDDNSDFGGETTGRIAAAWRPVEDLTFRAVIGTGYRAPSLFERFSAFGVPTLSPESSTSYEIGVEKGFNGRGFVKATIFYTEVEDVISFNPASTVCVSTFGCYTQIPGTSTSEGIELSGSYDINEMLTIFGSYTYVDARQNNGARFARTPKHDAVLGIAADFTKRLSGYVDITHVADVLPSQFAPLNNLVDDYTLLGLGMSYDVTDSTEVYFRVENITDTQYETAGGFNQPDASVYVGLRADF